MSEFNNYSFTNVNVIFGILELTGFAEGDDVVKIEVLTDQFNDLAGAKGDVVRSQTNDNRCTVTIKLLQNSSSNTALMTLFNLDKRTGAGGVNPMSITDKEANEIHFIKNCWIIKHPPLNRGQSPNPVEWIFRGDTLDSNTL